MNFANQQPTGKESEEEDSIAKITTEFWHNESSMWKIVANLIKMLQSATFILKVKDSEKWYQILQYLQRKT